MQREMLSSSVSRRCAHLLLAVVAAASVLGAAACAPPDPTGDVTLDESTTLPGSDGNGDGVRDDVGEVIENLPVDATMKTYLTESMVLEQRIMGLDMASDPTALAEESYEIASEVNELISCPPTGLDPADARTRADNLRALVANTEARQAQIAAFSALIDGRAFPAPDCGGGL